MGDGGLGVNVAIEMGEQPRQADSLERGKAAIVSAQGLGLFPGTGGQHSIKTGVDPRVEGVPVRFDDDAGPVARGQRGSRLGLENRNCTAGAFADLDNAAQSGPVPAFGPGGGFRVETFGGRAQGVDAGFFQPVGLGTRVGRGFGYVGDTVGQRTEIETRATDEDWAISPPPNFADQPDSLS